MRQPTRSTLEEVQVLTVAGKPAALRHARATVSSLATFEPRIAGTLRGRVPEACGEIIDGVAAVVASAPPFLTPEARSRHLSFLQHLCHATYEGIGLSFLQSGPLRDEASSRFGHVLSLWVESFLPPCGNGHHPLAASCALQTAVTLVDIAFGGHFWGTDGGSWELRGLFSDLAGTCCSGGSVGIGSPQLKHKITGSLRGTAVLVRVPEDGVLEALAPEPRAVFGPGDVFAIHIERCHLSTGFTDRDDFICRGGDGFRHDLDDRFRFRAVVAPVRVPAFEPTAATLDLVRDDEVISWSDFSRERQLPSGEIPGDWIVTALDGPPMDLPRDLIPIPWKPLGPAPGTC